MINGREKRNQAFHPLEMSGCCCEKEERRSTGKEWTLSGWENGRTGLILILGFKTKKLAFCRIPGGKGGNREHEVWAAAPAPSCLHSSSPGCSSPMARLENHPELLLIDSEFLLAKNSPSQKKNQKTLGGTSSSTDGVADGAVLVRSIQPIPKNRHRDAGWGGTGDRGLSSNPPRMDN